jgi:RNA polymerase sigma-70 factor (ECF subfamily)
MTVPAEFVTQVTRAQRRLHAFIVSIVWNPAEADDVLQETNLALWEKVSEFDASRPFMPWAMRFAQLQALAWLKRHRRQRVVFDDELVRLLADEAAAEPAFEGRRIALGECIQKLPAGQRDLIARRYEPEGSVNAMAVAAQTTAKAISDRLRRIRHALLQCIQRTLGEATA